jgi:hypothetical protein
LTSAAFAAAVSTGIALLWLPVSALAVATIGKAFGPHDAAADVKRHAAQPERTEYGRLFVNGETTIGVVQRLGRHRAEETVDLSIAYRFQTQAGREVTGKIAIDPIDEDVFAPGTSILILYDAADPQRHRVVVIDPADRLTPTVYRPLTTHVQGGRGTGAALGREGATREDEARQPAESEEENALI